jgi:hypothetical protein
MRGCSCEGVVIFMVCSGEGAEVVRGLLYSGGCSIEGALVMRVL